MKKIIRQIIKWLSKFVGCETAKCTYRNTAYFDMVIPKKDIALYTDEELERIVLAKLYEGLRETLTMSAECMYITATDTKAGDRIFKIEVPLCNCGCRCNQ